MELYPEAVGSDIDVKDDSDTDVEEDVALSVRTKKGGRSAEFDDKFEFNLGGEPEVEKELKFVEKYIKKGKTLSTLDEKIENERKKLKSGRSDEKKADQEEEEDEEELMQTISDSLKEKRKGKKRNDFFEEMENESELIPFSQMHLSRATLKAVADAGFVEPTPIQSACIPVVLAGKDICACASTGTGKTGSFVIPIVERLLYRPRSRPATRVLVLVPTRELAIQVFQVFRKLSACAQLDICLCAGGLDLKTQESALRGNPDVVVATPGRLIDHLKNAPSFHLQSVEVLVLDEADRMLEEAFEEQMKELIGMCAAARQTLLFSATMTDQIDSLASMSLKKPVRIFINENTETAIKLRQEFIRLRREVDREPILVALVARIFSDRTIIFVKTKKDCQRIHILLGLLGVKAAQLHGGLSQAQRVTALHNFKQDKVGCLVSTDLASRGLDIERVNTVINMHMPRYMKAYIHRVGRTARAGKTGRSLSIVGEDDRKLLKQIVNSNPDRVFKQRYIAPEVIEAFREKTSQVENAIERIVEEEKAERALRLAEDETTRAEQRINGTAERDGRKWIQKEKKDTVKKDKKQPKPKSAEDIRLERTAAFQAREAKRAKRGQRMRAVVEDAPTKNKKKRSHTASLTDIGRAGVKKARKGPEDDHFRQAKKQWRNKK